MVFGQVRSCDQRGELGVPHSDPFLLLLALGAARYGGQPQLELGRVCRCVTGCPGLLRYQGEARICWTSDASETRLDRGAEAR